MKKSIVIALLLVSGFVFAQNEPTLEEVSTLVKATYYFENGSIQQEGCFKEGKLDGKWISYTISGDIQAVAEYFKGEKTGRWKFYDNSVVIKEVDYSNNQIAFINNISTKPIAVKD